MKSIILQSFSRVHAPLQFGFSVYLLLRGHNLPGGGFIGGLVASGALALHLFSQDEGVPRKQRLLEPLHIAATGLFLATLSGMASLFAGGTYLESLWGGEIYLPLVGAVKLGTPLLFDVGVYFVVMGVCTGLIFAFSSSGNLWEDEL